ncbi:MAG: sigma-54-dependent Fis family transcriptional regulator, partial [Nitrospirae bacterium]
MEKATILVVDDEESIVETISGILEDEEYKTLTAYSGEEAVEKVKTYKPNVVILDVWLPGIDGIDTLKAIKKLDRSISVIMISGHGTIDVAVEATKLGAYDFIEKPPTIEKILIVVDRAIQQQRLERENIELKMKRLPVAEIIGESPAMVALKEEISRVAPTHGRVLILGESGTGKELVARAIHQQSKRKDKPFVEVNCAAIPTELIESELFGHEKGSFTGAVSKKIGKFELADGGTLFLDEIGDMSLVTQAKILRIIETQKFHRVGGSSTISVDVRLIAATNKDLLKEIKKGNFREDLYFRLNVIPIKVPPLRDRKEDIPLLVNHFLRYFAKLYGQRPKKVSKATLRALKSYNWPGNVRELKNTIERLVITTPSDVIDIDHISSSFNITRDDFNNFKSLKEARDNFEKMFITKKLQENNWNIS